MKEQSSLAGGSERERLPPHVSVAASCPSAVARVRAATIRCHECVDAAFSTFDLTDLEDYGRFLTAHARATLGAEAALASDPCLPRWRPRAGLLKDDLRALGIGIPASLRLGHHAAGALWGALYVLEGSRLGGAVLLKRAAAHFPRSFLASRHVGSEWRDLLGAIDAQAISGGAEWVEGLEIGARDCFALYLFAATAG